MVRYRFCNNNKQNHQKQQQRKVMIDMISMLDFINIVLYFMLFILRLTFCPNILLPLSSLTSQTLIMVYFYYVSSFKD